MVSPLCLGAMMFGVWGNSDHEESVRIIHHALDAGINFIDTADLYSGGPSAADGGILQTMSTSAQKKLARGCLHVKTLLAEAEEFIDSESYVFRTERVRRSPTLIEFHCFAREVQPPPDHWPLLAGEAVQNLRSALDHAVWRAWKDAGNPSDGYHTQFPITKKPTAFEEAAEKMLDGVPQEVRDRIEELQPYRLAPGYPEDEAISLLQRLSNADKHRDLATFACAVGFEMIGVTYPTEVGSWKPATGKPLGPGESEISSFVATSPNPITDNEVSPSFTYDVWIERIPLDMLISMGRRVFEAVTACETGQRPHPLAQYPI